MILIINLCKEKLHYYEFVKPIEDVLKNADINFLTKHYKEISNENIKKVQKIIICGTSLKDGSYIEDINKFKWIKNFKGSILGICAGFQILGLLFGGSLKKKNEIGFYKENFSKRFLGIKGEAEVYHLHKNYIDLSNTNEFEIFNLNEIAQAIKHKEKEFYGVLFHPEVRNKKMILNFAKL